MEQFNLDNLYALYPKTDKSKVYLLLDFTDTPKILMILGIQEILKKLILRF